MKTARRNGAKTPPARDKNGVVVMTLRMGKDDKRWLHEHCLALSAKEGHNVSYNEALLRLIRQARA